MEVKLIGVDVAKRVFELCGVDGCGETVLIRQSSEPFYGLRQWMPVFPGSLSGDRRSRA